ncbi:hypothetical protein D3C72_1774070 [compost metagenome]
MAQHGLHAAIHHLVGHHHGLLGIALVVFGFQLELHGLAANHHLLGIQLFDCHADAVFIVLAPVRHGPRQRRGVADLDGLRRLGVHRARQQGGSGNGSQGTEAMGHGHWHG